MSAALKTPIPASEARGRLTELRQALAVKFPAAQRKPSGCWPTGVAALDAPEGGLRCGAVTELSSSPGNGALFLHLLLENVGQQRTFAALVDAGGTFDPDSCPDAALQRLLWVICQDATVAVKAADMLLRDGNLPVLLLDFQMMTARQLSRIPASTWHRLQFLAENAASAFVVLTRKPMIESAQVRISLPQRWRLDVLDQDRESLAAALQPQVVSRRQKDAILRLVER